MQSNMLHFACRHHIFEIMLEAVLNISLPSSSSPDIIIFKRFQSKWTYISQEKYRTAMDNSFTANAVSDVRDDFLAFANDQLLNKQPRDDYRELLEITILFLGGTPARGVHFMAAAGMHRAHWMAKAIYSIKLWIVYDQVPLTKKEEQGMRDVAIFVVHVY